MGRTHESTVDQVNLFIYFAKKPCHVSVWRRAVISLLISNVVWKAFCSSLKDLNTVYFSFLRNTHCDSETCGEKHAAHRITLQGHIEGIWTDFIYWVHTVCVLERGSMLKSGLRESFSSCVFDLVWLTTDGPTVTHRQMHATPTPPYTHINTHIGIHTVWLQVFWYRVSNYNAHKDLMLWLMLGCLQGWKIWRYMSVLVA